MFLKHIFKAFIIIGSIIEPFTNAKGSKCFSINDSNYCKSFMNDGIKLYAGPNMFKKSLGVSLSNVKDFDEQLSNLRNNPVYPAERTYLESEFGCSSYDPFDFKDTNRYIYTYQCSSLINDKVSKCNEKESSKNKIKKICKSTCLLYYEAIQSIFNNTKSCQDESKKPARDAKLQEIFTHCEEYTDDSEGCLLGVDDEGKYCGYRNQDFRDKYCEENPTQVCCTKTRTEDANNDKLLKICLYVIGGVAILLVVVLIVLKIYSTNKNKRDEASRAEAEALERKREEEREKYREQLSKEYSDTASAPLLQQVSVNSSVSSPYNSPRPPPPAQSNNPNAIHRPGSNSPQPIINPRSTPQGPNHAQPRPPPQGARDSPRNGPSQPPQHPGPRGPGPNPSRPPPGARDSPRNSPSQPPQHQSSRGTPGSNPSRPPPPGSRDSPRNSPIHPPQHQGSRGTPGSNPSRPPPPGSRDSPRNGPTRPPQGSRDSPRNSPNHPPQHQGSRGSPNHNHNENDRPKLLSNNNR
jgi:hypothetical protein